MISRPDHLLSVAVAVSLVVDGRVWHQTFHLVGDVLDRGRSIEIVGSPRLAPTVALTLHHLTAEVRDVRVLNQLVVQMHLRLHMVRTTACTLGQSCHLDVLDLGLCHA